MKKIFVTMMAVATLVGCSKDDPKNEGLTGNKEIMAGATTLSVDVTSRSPINEIPAKGLIARVPISSSNGIYKEEWQVNPGYIKFMEANKATSFSDESGNDAPKFYPANESTPIYLCGLLPSEGWTIDQVEGKTATRTFSGCEDVMVAPQVSTQKTDASGSFKTLAFKHLLTQLRIKFKAVNPTAAEAWGQISKLALLDKAGTPIANEVTVNLTKGTATFSPKGTLNFYQMVNKDQGTDNPYVPTEVPTNGETYKAYTLCPSVVADGTSAAEYQLKITSVGGATETVNINLKAKDNSEDFNENTAGKAFDIILLFQATEIKAMATITPWEDMGSTEVPVGE